MQLPYSFGRYTLKKKIAQGGMAEIFTAQYKGESGFSKEIAIKRLLPIWSNNINFISMLIDEAKALVHLTHPNIVQIFDLGRDGETFYISMEWVRGIDLRRFFLKLTQEEIECPLSFILFIIGEVLKALDYAHNKKESSGTPLHLVHRDISPQNILLSLEGQVKLTDFGIAKGTHRSHETTQAQVKGKYAYMSPEQARGEAVDARTDLYALGVLFYELLERRRLFDGVNDLATLEQAREAKLPNEALQKWPAPLRVIVLRSLQKDPKYRYQSAAQFLSDLNRFVLREKLSADASDFSVYLQKIFPADVMDQSFEPDSFSDSGPIETQFLMKKRKWFLSPQMAATVAAFVIGVSAVGWFWKRHAHAHPRPVAADPQPLPKIPAAPLKGSITIDTQPKGLKGKLILGNLKKEFVAPFQLTNLDIDEEKQGTIEITPNKGKPVVTKLHLSSDNPDWVKTIVAEDPKPGSLKVSARPWGEVSIPGIVESRETPVSAVKLEPGEYRVKVHFPPFNQSTEKVVQVASGAEIVCQADFGEKPVLVCH